MTLVSSGSSNAAGDTSEPKVRAAQYVRMSTDHQQYSTYNQAQVLAEFAAKRGLEIVRTFCDAGKSGLSIDGRDALKELIHTVQSGQADFEVILVYDVSRWGRFQDADESAYYEYICKSAGIRVLYCAEGFENDDSPVSTIVKSIKRAMAGEYSRELSAKVFRGQCNLIQLGFRQGGRAGYGLRRLLVDSTGAPKGVLKAGEHKSVQTDRVVLVPGPDEEKAVVREIYRMFVHEAQSEGRIAAALNRAGVMGEDGCAWTNTRVHQVLTNEKYIGNIVYNRHSSKLKKRRVTNPESTWIRREAVFKPIVEMEDFEAAQARYKRLREGVSDAEMLGRLKELADSRGRLNGQLIDAAEGIPRAAAYKRRYGSLRSAYQRAGCFPHRDLALLTTRRRLKALKAQLVEEAVRTIEKQGGTVARGGDEVLHVNGMLSMGIFIARCELTLRDGVRWVIRMAIGAHPGRFPDVTIAVRMDEPNQAPRDYYLLPALAFRQGRLNLKDDNGRFLDAYRRTSLESCFEVAQTARIGRAA